MHRPGNVAPAVLLVLVVAGCDASTTPESTGGSPQSVTVTVEPSSAYVSPGGSVRFAATVTGTADGDVSWTVVEQDGGSIDATGRYTAPGRTGTFRVKAKSRHDPKTSGVSTVTVTDAPVAVAIAPQTASVAANGTLTFTATVSNATNGAVTWSIQEGTTCGTITAAGVYIAPATAGTCHVVATSQEDSTQSDTATVTVTPLPPPITVALTPSPAATNTCARLTFSATVTGTTNQSVTWSVQEGAAGGTITTAGVYTAPQSAGTYHVVARSVADGTKTAIAAVTVTDRIVSVAVSPAAITVEPGGTAHFTATVTTTCGSFVSTGAVTAPGG